MTTTISKSVTDMARPLQLATRFHKSPDFKRCFATQQQLHSSSSALDDWVARPIRPISLRQLTVFGRSLTESRLLSSANYVREELPTRIAHRLRDMQTLPYSILTNPHMSHVYSLYESAFDTFRRIPPVTTLAANDAMCELVRENLRSHLSVIPRLVMGVVESQDRIDPERMDALMNTLLRSRISRRVIAEQHLALTETFHQRARSRSPASPTPTDANTDTDTDAFVGNVFLRVHAASLIRSCATHTTSLCALSYPPGTTLPTINLTGHLSTTLTYIPSHLEYVLGELLRNSVQATVERAARLGRAPSAPVPPIEVLVCEAPQHVIIRVSDQGGGIDDAVLRSLWSFVQGPRRAARLRNLDRTPLLKATLQELAVPEEPTAASTPLPTAPSPTPSNPTSPTDSDSDTLTSRSPSLRLGIGLPMSRVYAEYWAGSLEVHNLEGYGVDAFLSVSRLGNRNERLLGREGVDGL